MKINASRLSLPLVVTLVFLCGATSALAARAQLNPAKHSITDLTKVAEKTTLKEGENTVFTAPDGYTVTALVKSGKVSSWIVRNENGALVKTKLYRRTVARRIRCWHCYKSKDGTINCFEIKCPF